MIKSQQSVQTKEHPACGKSLRQYRELDGRSAESGCFLASHHLRVVNVAVRAIYHCRDSTGRLEYGAVIHGNEADWWKHSRETPRTEVRRVIKLHVEVKDNTSVLVQRAIIQMALAPESCRSKVVISA